MILARERSGSVLGAVSVLIMLWICRSKTGLVVFTDHFGYKEHSIKLQASLRAYEQAKRAAEETTYKGRLRWALRDHREKVKVMTDLISVTLMALKKAADAFDAVRSVNNLVQKQPLK